MWILMQCNGYCYYFDSCEEIFDYVKELGILQFTVIYSEKGVLDDDEA